MSVALITGSAGLIGSETVKKFQSEGFDVVGIDNDMRAKFFGSAASTYPCRMALEKKFKNYRHYSADVRDYESVKKIFEEYRSSLEVIVHTAAQPSHDWAAREPFTDFGINAFGTLNLLEATRNVCPEAVFIFTSTNKVYGDTPNLLPLIEMEKRWEIDPKHKFYQGIDETMSMDQTKHSLFGASKAAADILVQEYGRYFGMKTGCFRAGCLTGPAHAAAELHGFLGYVMKCTVTGTAYRIFGYKGKQVRDNMHSYDVAAVFWEFFKKPRLGEVYNIGGGRHCNCSVLEAIEHGEKISGRKLAWTYVDQPRSGDHIWWISNMGRFQSHYPHWNYRYSLEDILREMYDAYTS